MKYTILVLDDDPVIWNLLCEDLPSHQFEVLGCGTCEKARQLLREKPVDAILVEYCLPDGTGVDFFRSIQSGFSNVPVIFITNFPNVDQAVQVMKEGATDYIQKPISVMDVVNRLRRVIEATNHRRGLPPVSGKHELIGSSSAIQAVRRAIAEVISSPPTPVLITGETGTGKTVVARLIHQGLHGDTQPFIEVDCAAIAKKLFEDELFGREQGADQVKEGILESGRKGTIFFYEIAELKLEVQNRLLGILETRQFRRVDGTHPVAFGARIIAATNRNIQQLLDENHFRPELYHRLAVYEIPIPPLRERREDIHELAEYFLHEAAMRHRKSFRRFSDGFHQKVGSHTFPGNVRELRNWVEQAVIQSKGEEADFIKRASYVSRSPAPSQNTMTSPIPRTLSEHERTLIEAALFQNKGNKSSAARQLGISRMSFLRRLAKIKPAS